MRYRLRLLERAVTAVRLPSTALVLLVGTSSAGKSTWAAAYLRPEQVVSTDALRALVGEGEDDQRAGTDAFAVLELVMERRLRRGLLTVVDSLGLDPVKRRRWRELAARHGRPCHAVVVDAPAPDIRARNKAKRRPLPAEVLRSQLRAADGIADVLTSEGFDGVHAAGPVQIVPPDLATAPAAAARQLEDPVTLRFGLQIPRFPWPAGQLGARLGDVAGAAEDAGFSSLWVMDHLVQIPQVGREWEDMPESWTTLAFLAGATERIRLGTLVTGVTYRNLAHLGKIVATLDVLSGGRVVCGLGAAWFEREHGLYGYAFPPVAQRFALLEDALELLPLLWGPGAPPFEGRTVSLPAATCYPRPLQEHVPILVGGSGERRTLKLVAQHADACNLFGDAATVARKVAVLRRHCENVGRDPAAVRVTHLTQVLAADDQAALAAAVAARTPVTATPEATAVAQGAGTVADQIGRFRALAEAGVQTAIVSLGDIEDPTAIPRFAQVIGAFVDPSDPHDLGAW